MINSKEIIKLLNYLTLHIQVQIVALDEDASEFAAKSTFDHPYPTTKIMWIPDNKGIFPDLLATSGDYLRVWRAGEPETRLECLLNNNKKIFCKCQIKPQII